MKIAVMSDSHDNPSQLSRTDTDKNFEKNPMKFYLTITSFRKIFIQKYN